MKLTDDLIQGAVDSISGYLAAHLVERLHKPVEIVLAEFLSSRTYAQLADKETGLYGDSIPGILEMFLREKGELLEEAGAPAPPRTSQAT